MNALRLAALLVYTLGAFAYGAMVVMWVRDLGARGWAGRPSDPVSATGAEAANGAMMATGFLWFLGNGAQLLLGLAPQWRLPALDAGLFALAFVFPPLIMHITWAEVSRSHVSLARPWRLLLWPAYILSLGLPIVLLPWAYAAADPVGARRALGVLSVSLSVAFICAAVYSLALVARRPGVEAAPVTTARGPLAALLGGTALIFLFLLWAKTADGGSHLMAPAALGLEITARSLPLIFVFVSSYFENRFHFFDVFVKRGAAFVLATAALTVWLALLLPLLRDVPATWAAPWIHAVALLPVVAAIPWLYRYIGALVDRRWLGRQFSSVDAVRHFLAALQSARSPAQLVARAEQALADVFGAPAAIRLDPAAAPPAFDVALRQPLVATDEAQGALLLGRRDHRGPYLSEDLALLSSLGDLFHALLENLRLQQRQHEQEQRAQELSLHASRSELKALRAQVNPHFLFNALNAIAGLIHRDPARADRTVEQLAEVFRYALRSPDDEWTVLEDELAFVQAYLDVERARFGERLQVEIAIDAAARRARIPALIVQTLVENAVKHGVTEVRGPAVVRVGARAAAGTLLVSVTDNGPGFPDGARPQERSAGTAGGYGLANVRQRLRGYYGERAALRIGRDVPRGLTTVEVELPLTGPGRTSEQRREAVT
jgi:signal transduction histidine kinase